MLRFWESKFPQLTPLKRSGGRRYYRPNDIELLRQIRQWLYKDGYTIRGVQDRLAAGAEPAPGKCGALPRPVCRQADRTALEAVGRELREARALLDQLLTRRKDP